jgi:hypothetical protein
MNLKCYKSVIPARLQVDGKPVGDCIEKMTLY